ncbi:lysophospholipid acyltransferase family protein [Solwaraspora sp. WMMD1047]|uniref:lysophospholipid acyltransferase family protein n=1 Tax=Solwaraspora sp. WMMD1047 TaxID=3016102 RepID=UPI003242361E
MPGPGRTPTVSAGRQVARFVALLGTLLLGMLLVPVLPLLADAGRRAAGRLWARAVLAALGVRLRVAGRLPDRRALLVANHVSWLDVLALLAGAPTQLLAKREVRGWPLIGSLAAAGGTIFVRRDRPRSLPETVGQVATALRAGGVVAVFPEGTTWCGTPARCGGMGRFRPAMFQAAIDAGTPVVPLSVRYRAGAAPGVTTAAAFLGRDSLWASVRRVLAVRDLVISLTVAGTLRSDAGADRRQLARAAESLVHRPGLAAGRRWSRGPARATSGALPGPATGPAASASAADPATGLELAA